MILFLPCARNASDETVATSAVVRIEDAKHDAAEGKKKRKKGSLAQLVQSVCLTSRGSGVRLPQLPPPERANQSKQRVGGSTPSAPTTRKGKSKQNPEVRRLRDFLFMAGIAKGRDRKLRLATPKKVAYFLYDYMEQKQRVIVYIGSLRSCLEQVGTQETVFPVSQNQRLPAH